MQPVNSFDSNQPHYVIPLNKKFACSFWRIFKAVDMSIIK